jgi:signal transduction histidine kinase
MRALVVEARDGWVGRWLVPRSLFGRLVAVNLLLSLIAIAGVSLCAGWVFARNYERARDKDLIGIAEGMAAQLKGQVSPSGINRKAVEQQLRWLSEALDVKVCLVDNQGRALAEAECCPPILRAGRRTEAGHRPLSEGISKGLRCLMGSTMLTATQEVRDAQGRKVGLLYVHAPATGLLAPVSDMRAALIVIAAALALLSVALSLLVARSVAAPLSRLTAAIESIRAGGWGETTSELHGTQEVRALATTFNALSGELGQTFARLQTERDLTLRLLDSLAEGVLAVSAQGQVVLANPQAARLLGLELPKVMGKPVAELPGGGDLGGFLSAALAEGRGGWAELSPVDGGVPLLAVASPVHDPRGGLWGLVAVVREASERRSTDELERALLAAVSHELRTPLTAIRGFAEAIIDRAQPEQQERYLRIILDEALRLQGLIDRIFDLAKLQESSVPLRLQPLQMTALIRKVADSFQLQAQEKSVRLITTAPDGLPPVPADEEKIHQVLANLVSNALKHSPQGGAVTIAARQVEDAVEVAVTDNGPGLSETEAARVWEAFYTGDQARRQQAGLGLGLAIVRRIVELHGGSVGVTSQPGKGASFRFVLPSSVRRES